MLRTRVATALALLALVVSALAWLPIRGWAMFVLVFVAAAAWEWGRLCGLARGFAPLYAGLVTLLAVLILFSDGAEVRMRASLAIYGSAAACWLGIALCWFLRGPAAPRGAWLAGLGILVLLPCWWAVVNARAAGALFMFLLMGLVWIADIAAYFAGRRFGRHKLAPAVSPGKTWEGVAGAMTGGGLLATTCALATTASGGPMDSWFAWIIASAGGAGAAGLAALLCVAFALVGLSILGDLFESLLKRRAGVKDSSALLPGHGGVLDRIDALIPTMPIAMLIYSAIRAA